MAVASLRLSLPRFRHFLRLNPEEARERRWGFFLLFISLGGGWLLLWRINRVVVVRRQRKKKIFCEDVQILSQTILLTYVDLNLAKAIN